MQTPDKRDTPTVTTPSAYGYCVCVCVWRHESPIHSREAVDASRLRYTVRARSARGEAVARTHLPTPLFRHTRCNIKPSRPLCLVRVDMTVRCCRRRRRRRRPAPTVPYSSPSSSSRDPRGLRVGRRVAERKGKARGRHTIALLWHRSALSDSRVQRPSRVWTAPMHFGRLWAGQPGRGKAHHRSPLPRHGLVLSRGYYQPRLLS